jgi:hypothetical protein
VDPQDFDSIERPAAQTEFTTKDIVADLDHAMQLAAFFEVAHPLRVRARIARLRQFLAEIERAADAGIGLDWADCITLPSLERAVKEELALRSRLARWGRGRGGL